MAWLGHFVFGLTICG